MRIVFRGELYDWDYGPIGVWDHNEEDDEEGGSDEDSGEPASDMPHSRGENETIGRVVRGRAEPVGVVPHETPLDRDP